MRPFWPLPWAPLAESQSHTTLPPEIRILPGGTKPYQAIFGAPPAPRFAEAPKQCGGPRHRPLLMKHPIGRTVTIQVLSSSKNSNRGETNGKRIHIFIFSYNNLHIFFDT